MNYKRITIVLIFVLIGLIATTAVVFAAQGPREIQPDFYLMDGEDIEGAVWLGDASGGYIAEAYYEGGEMLLSTPSHFCPCGEECE